MGLGLNQPVAMSYAEVRRYIALKIHHIVKLLDVEAFPMSARDNYVGLVFACYDVGLRKFLKMPPLKLSGMRHVLRCLLAALGTASGGADAMAHVALPRAYRSAL